jgi:hypothetical protein
MIPFCIFHAEDCSIEFYHVKQPMQMCILICTHAPVFSTSVQNENGWDSLFGKPANGEIENWAASIPVLLSNIIKSSLKFHKLHIFY